MHIAIPILGHGRSGGNRVLSRLATEWGYAEHRVTFLAHAAGERPYFPTAAETVWIDDAGRAAPHAPDPAALAGARGVVRNVAALARGLSRQLAEADVVLANHALTAWSVAAARTRGRRFHYVQAYEPELYDRPGAAQRALALVAAGAYRLPFTRIVNAPMYQTYRNLRARHVVPPGLDFAQFHPEHDCATTSRSALVIGCIGRVEPWKGTRFAVEAFRTLRRSGMNAVLRVAYGNVDHLLPVEGLEVAVPRDDWELAAFYRSLDVLIAPGTSQLGAPHYPVLEAMACGAAVVTTGYMPATAENAWLVPVGDPDAIAAAVVTIASDPQERAAKIARALADVQAFAWPTVAAGMLAAFGG